MRTAFTLVAVLLAAIPQRAAGEYDSRTFSSGPGPTPLIELYTSEGCSSCPPADRWLSALEDDKGLWRDFVPVALHVDYWDYIGWQDRFASRRFSDRQRRYAAEGGVRVVYTPGVFRDGREWRGWRGATPKRNAASPVGKLTLNTDGRDYSVRFEPAPGVSADTVHIAVLGMGLETEVRAGENRGRTLAHDFVVLALQARELDARDGALVVSGVLPEASAPASRLAVAAWVSADPRQTPMQAVGGFLDE